MTYDPSKFYVWQATGTQLNIHLSLAVIEELNQRRAELDGDMSAVLLGYSMIAPHRATFVDDFVLLPPSWNLRGGAYSADFEATRSEIVSKLAEGAEYGRHAIGFCRWQQEGALELSGGDFAAAQRFFAETDNVLLLVRSLPYQVGEAALFYWDGGKLQVPEQSSHFPFEVNQLSSRPRISPSAQPRHCGAVTPRPAPSANRASTVVRQRARTHPLAALAADRRRCIFRNRGREYGVQPRSACRAAGAASRHGDRARSGPYRRSKAGPESHVAAETIADSLESRRETDSQRRPRRNENYRRQ